MKKKILSAVLAASFAVSCAGAAIAADKAPSVYVNTANILFEDQKPVILGEGTTLIPARGVFESMGANVKWDGRNQKVDIKKDGRTMTLFIDSDTALFDGEAVTLEMPAKIKNGRTMVPLRFVMEAFDIGVDWDQSTRTVEITK